MAHPLPRRKTSACFQGGDSSNRPAACPEQVPPDERSWGDGSKYREPEAIGWAISERQAADDVGEEAALAEHLVIGAGLDDAAGRQTRAGRTKSFGERAPWNSELSSSTQTLARTGRRVAAVGSISSASMLLTNNRRRPFCTPSGVDERPACRTGNSPREHAFLGPLLLPASLSRARTPKTHSWTRRRGSLRTKRSSPSTSRDRGDTRKASRPTANVTSSQRALDSRGMLVHNHRVCWPLSRCLRFPRLAFPGDRGADGNDSNADAATSCHTARPRRGPSESGRGGARSPLATAARAAGAADG
jgi:hypothetical protein